MDRKCPQCGSVETGPSFTFDYDRDDSGRVSSLGCIDLGDRRSRVQISAARQKTIPPSRLGGPSGSPAGRPVALRPWRSTATRSDQGRTSPGRPPSTASSKRSTLE